MSSTSDKLSGKTKETAGQASDDNSLKIKGKLEQVRGKAKDVANDMTRNTDKKTN